MLILLKLFHLQLKVYIYIYYLLLDPYFTNTNNSSRIESPSGSQSNLLNSFAGGLNMFPQYLDYSPNVNQQLYSPMRVKSHNTFASPNFTQYARRPLCPPHNPVRTELTKSYSYKNPQNQ
jgi:hypothetical protein